MTIMALSLHEDLQPGARELTTAWLRVPENSVPAQETREHPSYNVFLEDKTNLTN